MTLSRRDVSSSTLVLVLVLAADQRIEVEPLDHLDRSARRLVYVPSVVTVRDSPVSGVAGASVPYRSDLLVVQGPQVRPLRRPDYGARGLRLRTCKRQGGVVRVLVPVDIRALIVWRVGRKLRHAILDRCGDAARAFDAAPLRLAV